MNTVREEKYTSYIPNSEVSELLEIPGVDGLKVETRAFYLFQLIGLEGLLANFAQLHSYSEVKLHTWLSP